MDIGPQPSHITQSSMLESSEDKVNTVLHKPTQNLKQKSTNPLHLEKLLDKLIVRDQTNTDQLNKISTTTDQLNKLFDEFDTNHDEKIEKKEWINLYPKVLQKFITSEISSEKHRVRETAIKDIKDNEEIIRFGFGSDCACGGVGIRESNAKKCIESICVVDLDPFITTTYNHFMEINLAHLHSYIFIGMDVTRSNQVRAEHEKIYKRHATNIFELLDEDKNGTLDKPELSRGFIKHCRTELKEYLQVMRLVCNEHLKASHVDLDKLLQESLKMKAKSKSRDVDCVCRIM